MDNDAMARASGFTVEVVKATPEQSVVVANLFELYAHDFSAFHDVEPGEDGRFGSPIFTSTGPTPKGIRS